jgi:hypothetical protein
VLGALILSIPLSVLTSRVGPGRALRRRGLFLIPEETQLTPVLDATRKYAQDAGPRRDLAAAIADPSINALVCAYGVPRRLSRSARLQRWRLARRVLHDGLDALTEHTAQRPDRRSGGLVGAASRSRDGTRRAPVLEAFPRSVDGELAQAGAAPAHAAAARALPRDLRA